MPIYFNFALEHAILGRSGKIRSGIEWDTLPFGP
jgi:hypothetical protein